MTNEELLSLNSGKKFDIVLMNPPYDRSLHLKFLEKAVEISDNVVSIQPIRWLQDPLAKYKKSSDYEKYEDNISKHIENIEIIDTKTARKQFNIEVLQPLGIFTINSTKNSDFYKTIFNYDVFDKIEKKIVSENNFDKMNIKKYNDDLDGYYVCLSRTAPPMKYGNPMFYALKQIGVLSKENNYRQAKLKLKGATRGTVENTNCVVFKSKKEAENCYKSFSTTFVKYVCATSVVNIDLHQQFLPWMKDYANEWTNKRFCEYFNITGYISDTEAEPNSDWEEILNTMDKLTAK